MTYIDPTYLRNVRDGLESGSYDKTNPASLPDGIIGIFEEALSSGLDVRIRKDLMDFFTVWSIVKRDVSLEFVHSLLPGWSMDRVSDHVQSYSRWFNAIKPGRLQLYHERLRVFLLQRTSQSSLMFFNQAIIDQCRMALDRRSGDEWETYALQYMSKHLLLASIDSESAGAQLQKMAYDTFHWDRQLGVSKNFEWTRSMLKDMMQWASRYNEDPMVECALNLVDLHHREQNDASRIVQLVADGDIDTALLSIEAFGGKDKDGLRRKCTLYFLCLMELTLLSGKDKPFRKASIEQLLNHFDEQLPKDDDSILNWNDFFPSYLVFLMATEWAEMGLDYIIVYRRTNNWDTDWLAEKGPYSEIQLELLRVCARRVDDRNNHSGDLLMDIAIVLAKQQKIIEAFSCIEGIIYKKHECCVITAISAALAKQGKTEEGYTVILESLSIARGIINEKEKCDALLSISSELAKQGKKLKAGSVIEESLSIARGITYERGKNNALLAISSELAKQGKTEEGYTLILESLSIARGTIDESEKCDMLTAISAELAKQGRIEESFLSARDISDEHDKSHALLSISSELAEQGKIEQATSVIKECLTVARRIRNKSQKSYALTNISSELRIQGKKEEASVLLSETLSISRGIHDDGQLGFVLFKGTLLLSISTELAKQGNINDASILIKEAISVSWDEDSDDTVRNDLKDVSTELVNKGNMQLFLSIAHGIRDEKQKNTMLNVFSSKLSEEGKIKEASSLMQESLSVARSINVEKWSSFLLDLTEELVEQGKMANAISIARNIGVDYINIRAIKVISAELLKMGREKEFLSIARGISDRDDFSQVLLYISEQLAKQGKFDKALSMLKGYRYRPTSVLSIISKELAKQGKIEESLSIASGIGDDMFGYQRDALLSISSELAKQGRIPESLTVARGISDERRKCEALLIISTDLAQQGKMEEASILTEESLSIARGISNERKKCGALSAISTELAKQGKMDEASTVIFESLSVARGISEESEKCHTLLYISSEFAKQLKLEEALSIIKETLSIARGISLGWERNRALSSISTTLAEQGRLNFAEEIGLEITKGKDRHNCWYNLARARMKNAGAFNTLDELKVLNKEDARIFCLKTWVNIIPLRETNSELLKKALPALANDTQCIETFLQKYALQVLFLGNEDKALVDRLNRTINIQWALDIAASFQSEN